MNKTIRFADLECLLLRLGFQRFQTPESQIVFENRAENSMLIFPAYQPDDVVQPHHWIKTRWQLDAHGFLDRDAFDRIMEEGMDMADCVPA